MKIVEVHAYPLYGREAQGGWGDEVANSETLHSLVEVVTDEGLNGWGSVYTTYSLTEAALRLLRSWLIGQNALEPEHVSEMLHQTTFWQGRGGAVTHAISGIDVALWDILGKATGQPVARLSGGCYRDRIKPYGSILFEDAGPLRDRLHDITERGFRAIKLGWGPFGRLDRKTDELLVRMAREAVGPDVELMVDAGGQRRVLAAWPEVGAGDGPHARRLRRRLVRGGATARRLGRFRRATQAVARPYLHWRGVDATAELYALAGAAGCRHHSA